MTRQERQFTNILRSRGVALILSLLGVWMAYAGVGVDLLLPAQWGALLLVLLTAAVMIGISRKYNLLRTASVFFAAFFILSTCSTPTVLAYGPVPALLACVVMACISLMFSIYNERRSDRRIFLVFTLLSAGALLDFTFLFYIPLFLIGLGQMRVFRFKKLLAAIVGIVTPWWIVWGLDIMPLPSVPRIYFTPPSMLVNLGVGWPFIVAVAATMFIGFFTGTINLLKIIGFNARARALNGLLSLVSIATGLFAIVNFTALPTYVVLLNACVAFQVGHFFRSTASRRGYIFVLSFIAVYIGLYIWNQLRLG